jgi:hypothetical protein
MIFKLKKLKNKIAMIGTDEVMKWVLYLILIGVGILIIRNIFSRFS